jgi:hypothetical protein
MIHAIKEKKPEKKKATEFLSIPSILALAL